MCRLDGRQPQRRRPHFWDDGIKEAVSAHVIVRINPSTGIRFLVKFGSLRLPRLTLNAAVCSEIQVPRVMLGGGAKKGSSTRGILS